MNLLKKMLTVASGTFLSRILGFIREIFMAIALGTGPVADAFNAAFRLPNSFRRLFAEGAFNAAFIPLFSKEIEEKDKTAAINFAQEILGILFTVLILITIALELAMPLLVNYILAPGFRSNPDKLAITISLAKIMFPYLICMSLAAMMAGMLNAFHKYFAAAIAPVFLNIVLIIVLLIAWIYKLDQFTLGNYLAWGVLLAGIIQLAILAFALYKNGIKLKLKRPRFTSKVKQLLWLAFPAAITGGVTQINLLVSNSIASKQAGAVSSLMYADRLYQLPLGMVGIAVATVLLPELSRALKAKDYNLSYTLQNRALEFTLLLTLPAAVGFLLLAEPIVALLFQHGQFTYESTKIVSQILAIYGLGLPAVVLIKNFTPAFFAREDTKTPLIFAVISIIINIIGVLVLFPSYSVLGIAFSEITAAWVNVLLLAITLLIKKQWKPDLLLYKRCFIISIAALAMAAFIVLIFPYFSNGLSSEQPFIYRSLHLITLIILAAVGYFMILFALDNKQLKKLIHLGKHKR